MGAKPITTSIQQLQSKIPGSEDLVQRHILMNGDCAKGVDYRNHAAKEPASDDVRDVVLVVSVPGDANGPKEAKLHRQG